MDNYLNPGPSREEVDNTKGRLLLEFGTAWCGHCKAARPLAAEVLKEKSEVKYIQIEDGQGLKLGL